MPYTVQGTDHQVRSVLNAGGGDKNLIPLPPVYEGWKQWVLDIDMQVRPDICADLRFLHNDETWRNSFDSVYLSHVLEHFQPTDTQDILKGCHHALKPGGFLFIRIPSMELLLQACNKGELGLQESLSKILPNMPEATTGHEMIYGKDELYMHHYRHFLGHELVSEVTKAGFTRCDAGYWPEGLEIMAIATKGDMDPEIQKIVKERLF